jgi:hypothetical protein
MDISFSFVVSQTDKNQSQQGLEEVNIFLWD